jgi:DNA topoisomerase-3
MVQVCESVKSKAEMLAESIEQYRDMYRRAKNDFETVIRSVTHSLRPNAAGGRGGGGASG